MATILSQHSTTGFYKAPVTKGLLVGLSLAYTAIHVPILAHLRKHLHVQITDIIYKHEVWKLLMSRFAFIHTKDVVCGALIIYYFRIFERRFGSHAFASFLFATSLLSMALEVIIVYCLHAWAMDPFQQVVMPPGPYMLIFPLYAYYFFDIPRVTRTYIMGIPVTDKTLTYLLGLQICSSSIGTFISALSGLVAGLLYRVNFLRIQQLLKLPNIVAKLFDKTLGRLLDSGDSPESPIPLGATLELQRQQQMELLEQQIILSRMREMRRRQRQPRVGATLELQRQQQMELLEQQIILSRMREMRRRQRQPHVGAMNPEDEELQVKFLEEMGFERASARHALHSSNYNLEAATSILLREAGSS
ncbi:unnamed protein product [Darwinula stevensoni]|uniref:UBA domain-containing protein n=1 Tax=Darwinula stevensoni TaxID=69355 RepID=A0A7R9ABP4_9CRUS|nr:unnamed protein product [Darwinula stevensoni]CAG0899612.1 unnamed protein product [Darwinula stevensoni]